MFSKVFTLALFASSEALAAAILSAINQVEERELNPSVQLCSSKDFNDCDTVNFHYGQCQSAGRLNDKVSFLKANGHKCILYNDTRCRDGNGQIDTTGDFAGIRSHSSFSTMNDDISSFSCNI